MAVKIEDNWLVYIILADDGSFYTGITNNIHRRWLQHKEQKGGAKYFRARKPKEIIYLEAGFTRSSASKRESAIKNLSRSGKEVLIASGENQISILSAALKLSVR